MRRLPGRSRPQAIKCRARICGHLLPKDAERCDRCDWVRGATQTAEGKASDMVAVMFSIVPGLGHIYKGHICVGLLWMIGAIPVGIFVLPCCVCLCRVGTRPIFLLSRRGDASCLRDPRSCSAAERGRRRGVLSRFIHPQIESLAVASHPLQPSIPIYVD